ncbi:hypothetical protein [Vibrio sp. 10N]|nr:hypothetical protein VB10N_32790 [Vibrio sp. 10N]
MSYELGSVYVGQMAAKKMMDEMLYGKAQPKKKSFVKRMMKKLSK